jgi:hypothetical protein
MGPVLIFKISPELEYTQIRLDKTRVICSVADPGSGAFLTPGYGGMGKKSRSGFGSGMNIPEHISKTLETIF